MVTIFINSENNKTSDPHSLLLNLAEKTDLKKIDKYIELSNVITYHKWQNIQKVYKSNKFKISATTWHNKFELPDRSYSISVVQDRFEYINKK